jgi:lipid-A-disaccharide synthase
MEARAGVAVLVDSPALHVPLGRMLRRAGIPVVHFVTPQHWGWAPWRSSGYPSAVDLALAILPFEREWFRRRGVRCDFVGHPLLDELPERSRSEPEGPRDALVVLAGSREGVLGRNLPWMWSVLAELRLRHPGLRIVVAHDRPELRGWIERELAMVGAHGKVELALGDLHRTLERDGRAAFSVSGTVLLDLLHQRLPCVVIYRLASRRQAFLQRHFLTAPHIASINLLAAGRVVPEHAFAGDGPRREVIAELERALFDEAWRAECRLGLERAAARLGSPGACARAARAALNLIAPGPVRSDLAGSKSS